MKYKKKPVEIEAIKFTDSPENIEILHIFMDIDDLNINRTDVDNAKLEINTLEGIMEASIGDYIIKGVKGEFYPCREDIFKLTYEKV